jgi:hypothetical protein
MDAMQALEPAQAILSAKDVHSIYHFFDYLKTSQECLAALVLAVAGSFAWLFQRYMAWRNYQQRRKASEVALALKTEISLTISSYERVFTKQSYRATLKKIREMRSHARFRPFVIAEGGPNFIFDTVKVDIAILPLTTIEPIVTFYSAENMFSASYQCLGSERLAQAGYYPMRITTREVFENAKECIESGQAALGAVKRHMDRHHGVNRAVLFFHCLFLIALIVAAAIYFSVW